MFRLIGSSVIGASVAWSIASLVIGPSDPVPILVDGAVWVIRTLASVLLVAGTGLALLQRADHRRTTSAPDVLFAFGLTILFAVAAHFMSPYVPLATTVFFPLFWSGVRFRTSVAALHAAFTAAVILAMSAANQGAVVGSPISEVSLSVRLHLMVVLSFVISLVVATAVNEFMRLNADLEDVADRSRRRAAALRTVTMTIPDALLTVDHHGVATPLNESGHAFVTTDRDGITRLAGRPGRPGSLPAGNRLLSRAVRGRPIAAEPFSFTDAAGLDRTFELTAAPLVSESSDEADRTLILLRDVSDQHRLLRELEQLAESDPLTGLANRRRFDKDLGEQIELHRRNGTGGGVLVLDLDGFKEINDTFGHSCGDDVLIGVADVLSSSTRATDLITRLGGDEFGILVPHADRDQLEALAQLLVERVRGFAQSLEGIGRSLTASVGGVTIEAAERKGLDPLAAADSLMYDVKHSGRNAVLVVGDSTVEDELPPTSFEWKSRLERALGNGDMVLHLQPMIDVGSQRVVGAEALIRLDDHGTLLSPAEFVPFAERSGVIDAVDRWAMRNALPMLARLRALDPGFSIWINVSVQSIGDAELERILIDGVAEYGVPPSAVVIVLTETVKVADADEVRRFASRLRAAGFRLAVSDFGSGVGSLLNLKHQKVDYLKLDGALTNDLDTSESDRAIVNSIVALTRGLGMQAVAGDVRSREVFEAVRGEGIDFAQGAGLGRPCPEDQFVDQFLHSNEPEGADGARPPATALSRGIDLAR